jgi:hypothetical protein
MEIPGQVSAEIDSPAFDEVEFWPDGSKLGKLRGLCPDCASTMNRRDFARQAEVGGGRFDGFNATPGLAPKRDDHARL